MKVWDAASGAERATLKGHTGVVTSVAFSPDATRIVSGSWDKTVKVWDAASGAELDEKPDPAWQDTNRRKHPAHNWWLHPFEDQVIVLDLDLSERELAYRRGRALFRPFEANEEYEAAPTPYAKAFWKGRFALNRPDKSEHWDAFRQECNDPATWRLLKQTCDLVLQKGPNERAKAERDWAIAQLAKAAKEPERLPMPREK